MKKLFPILILLLFTGCIAAQDVQPEKKITTPLKVITIAGEEITFQHESGKFLVAEKSLDAVRIPDNLEFEENKIYRVNFKYLDCDNCPKRKILIRGFSVDPLQAQKDAAEIFKI